MMRLAAIEPIRRRPATRSPPDAAAGSRLRRARVLVVEDDFLAALAAEAALEEAGFEVVALAASGEEALALAEKTAPELVVMDVRLAGAMDGLEAGRRLSQAGVAVLFATAQSDPETRARGEAARPAGWLTKPFSAIQLGQAAQAALEARRAS